MNDDGFDVHGHVLTEGRDSAIYGAHGSQGPFGPPGPHGPPGARLVAYLALTAGIVALLLHLTGCQEVGLRAAPDDTWNLDDTADDTGMEAR